MNKLSQSPLVQGMFKLNKKAFSMLEVVISISLFLILFTSSLTVTAKYLKLRSYNLRLSKSIVFYEGLVNTMKYNECLEETTYINNNSPQYIYEEDMVLGKLKEDNFHRLTKKLPPNKQDIFIIIEGIKSMVNENQINIKLELKIGDKSYKYELSKELKKE